MRRLGITNGAIIISLPRIHVLGITNEVITISLPRIHVLRIINASTMQIPRHTHAQVVNEINSPPYSHVKNSFDRRDQKNGKKSLMKKSWRIRKMKCLKAS